MAERRHEGQGVTHAVSHAFAGLDRVMLAVSGGIDSMVLLYAAAALPSARGIFLNRGNAQRFERLHRRSHVPPSQFPAEFTDPPQNTDWQRDC